MRARITLFIGIVAAIMTLIASGMAGNALYEILSNEWWPELEHHRLSAVAGIVSLLALSFLVLFKNRQVFQAVRGLRQEECTTPLPCVIMLLSPPDRKDVSFSEEPFSIAVGEKRIPTISLEHDIEVLEGTRWPWQQMLRGLQPHTKDGVLQRVYLIGSADTDGRDGSKKYLPWAKRLIKHYFPHVHVELHPSAVHFEDFNALAEALTVTLLKLKKEKYKERQIIVDVTGGQKTTSIAGAVVTFNSGVTFQYVQTEGKHKVLRYDVVIESPPSL